MMMRSEYDRSYQWNSAENDYGTQHFKNKHRFSEPIMTHKRRVKLAEDNVIIGEPLPSQNDKGLKEDAYFSLGDKDKTFHSSIPYKEFKAFDQQNHIVKLNKPKNPEKTLLKKQSKSQSRHLKYEKQKPVKFINEAVQTEQGVINKTNFDKSTKTTDKSTQITLNVPETVENNSHNQSIKTGQKDYTVSKNIVNNLISYPSSRKTEYQTKYAWTEPISKPIKEFDKSLKNSSKLDMKLKIYNNFLSEYQRQFRPYEFVHENRFKRMKPTLNQSYDESNIQVMPEKSKLYPRSLTPPPKMKFNEKSISPQHSMNPQRMSFPHGKQKHFATEYSANFDNKWKRLESEIQKNLEDDEARKSTLQSKWFKDILELRKKAHEYRQRSRGTHFSREHLGEIFTKSSKQDYEEYDDDNSQSARGRIALKKNIDSFSDHCWDLNNRNKSRSNSPKRNRHKHSTNDEVINRHNPRYKRSSSVEETVRTPTSIYSSSESTIVEQLHKSNSKRQPPRSSKWQEQSAGKPSYDNSLLLDEEASHDTEIKDEFNYQDNRSKHFSPTYNLTNNKCLNSYPEKKYTFHRYFNDDCAGNGKNMKTMEYDEVSSSLASKMSSAKSLISSSSRSLAIETLERAKRNRDEVLRSKT